MNFRLSIILASKNGSTLKNCPESKMENFITPLHFKKSFYITQLFSDNRVTLTYLTYDTKIPHELQAVLLFLDPLQQQSKCQYQLGMLLICIVVLS